MLFKLILNAFIVILYISAYADCPAGYIFNPYTMTCYGKISLKLTWDDAKTYCEMKGENLAVFDNRKSIKWFGEFLTANPG